MIDTWLFASLCLFFLALCAVLRTIPGPSRFDRIVAVNVALTIAVAGALALSVSLGNPLIIDFMIVVAALGYSGIFAFTYLAKEVGI